MWAAPFPFHVRLVPLLAENAPAAEMAKPYRSLVGPLRRTTVVNFER